jgi:hypothetical protein
LTCSSGALSTIGNLQKETLDRFGVRIWLLYFAVTVIFLAKRVLSICDCEHATTRTIQKDLPISI